MPLNKEINQSIKSLLKISSGTIQPIAEMITEFEREHNSTK